MTINEEQRKAYGLLYATVSLSLDRDIPAGQRIDIAAGMVADHARKDLIEEIRRDINATSIADHLHEMQGEYWWEGGMVATYNPTSAHDPIRIAVALSAVTGVWFVPDGCTSEECDIRPIPIDEWKPGHWDWERQHLAPAQEEAE